MGNSILGIRSICSSNVYTSPQYVFDSYKEWVSILEVKNDVNELSFYQNISLLGMVRKITHAVEYSDMWLIFLELFYSYCLICVLDNMRIEIFGFVFGISSVIYGLV